MNRCLGQRFFSPYYILLLIIQYGTSKTLIDTIVSRNMPPFCTLLWVKSGEGVQQNQRSQMHPTDRHTCSEINFEVIMFCACMECSWVSYTWDRMPSSQLMGWDWLLKCQVSRVHLCQNGGMTAFVWVLFKLMVCRVFIACSATADLSGWPLVRTDVFFYSFSMQSLCLSHIGGWDSPGIHSGTPHQFSSLWELGL